MLPSGAATRTIRIATIRAPPRSAGTRAEAELNVLCIEETDIAGLNSQSNQFVRARRSRIHFNDQYFANRRIQPEFRAIAKILHFSDIAVERRICIGWTDAPFLR